MLIIERTDGVSKEGDAKRPAGKAGVRLSGVQESLFTAKDAEGRRENAEARGRFRSPRPTRPSP